MSTDRFCDLVRELTRGTLKEKEFLKLFMVEFQCTWGSVLRALAEYDIDAARQLAVRMKAGLPALNTTGPAADSDRKEELFAAAVRRVCEKKPRIIQREIRLLERIAGSKRTCKASELKDFVQLYEERLSAEAVHANLSRLAAADIIAVPRKGRYVSTVHTEAYIAALKNELALRSGTENKVK